MISETSFIDLALRSWKDNSAGTFLGALSQEELQRELAPGKNRLIYLWGHLTAVNDRMVAILGFGERLYPELDAMFVSNPDKTVHLTLSPEKLKSNCGRTLSNTTIGAAYIRRWAIVRRKSSKQKSEPDNPELKRMPREQR
jgi:hypothetical protein